MADYHPKDPFCDPKAVCFICRGAPSAYWAGEITVYICWHCAVHKLPGLIADATSPGAMPKDPESIMTEVSACFYRGMYFKQKRVEDNKDFEKKRQKFLSDLDEAQRKEGK